MLLLISATIVVTARAVYLEPRATTRVGIDRRLKNTYLTNFNVVNTVDLRDSCL